MLYRLPRTLGTRPVREDPHDAPRVEAFECRGHSDHALQRGSSQYWVSAGSGPKGRWRNLARSYLASPTLVAKVAPAPTRLKSFALALGNRTSETLLPDYFGTLFDWHKNNSITNNATYLSNGNSSVISNIFLFSPITRNVIDPVRRADVPLAFIAAY